MRREGEMSAWGSRARRSPSCRICPSPLPGEAGSDSFHQAPGNLFAVSDKASKGSSPPAPPSPPYAAWSSRAPQRNQPEAACAFCAALRLSHSAHAQTARCACVAGLRGKSEVERFSQARVSACEVSARRPGSGREGGDLEARGRLAGREARASLRGRRADAPLRGAVYGKGGAK
ncbi:unnamed protein product [Rangifer tarandus platyrhynchus]|uniref:Uncharacterized protein n=1 Tax=Rangifer tarandus platyrhynchus TaxID=3082113 RepID=A0ABN8YHZ6_RANTA|nr:unnamed protein product [Rangifer tarandus platyrhynchus]